MDDDSPKWLAITVMSVFVLVVSLATVGYAANYFTKIHTIQEQGKAAVAIIESLRGVFGF